MAVSLRSLSLLATAGVGGAYLSNNLDSASRSISSVFVKALQLAGMLEPELETRNASAVQAISEQVSALARDVSRSSNKPVVILGPASSRVAAVADALALAGWATLVVSVSGTVYYVAVWKKWCISDVAWVSHKSFTKTVNSMQEGIARVRSAVTTVRREVAERLRDVEARVEAVRAVLGAQIENEVSEVKSNINDVSKEVQNAADIIADVNIRIDAIDGKLDRATHGIMALVRVVSSLAPDGVRPDSPFYALKRLAANEHPSESRSAESRRLSFGLSDILPIEGLTSPTSANGLLNKSGKILQTTHPS